MTSNALNWLVILAFVAGAQFFAADEWEKRLWRKGPDALTSYLKIGFYWSGCGASVLMFMLALAVDPDLFLWMASNGLAVAWLALTSLATAWIAWAMVHRPDCIATRVFNLTLVAGSLTFSYPLLKYLQQGVWLVYPYHAEAFALFMLSIYALLQTGVLTLGFKQRTSTEPPTLLHRLTSDPKFTYTAACVVLNVLWCTIQINLIRQYPVEFRSIKPDETNLAFAFGYTEVEHFTWTTLAVIVYTLILVSFNYRKALSVQDAIMWTSDKATVPVSYARGMENTGLVKKALGLSNLAVVTWHAPESMKGIGTLDFQSGTTFISPGKLHEEGLKQIGDNINLPDFWKAILHPDDYAGAASALNDVLTGKTEEFVGKSRFRSPDGGWFNIRGHAKVERSPVNDLPVCFYGIHVDITDEEMANELLGATKVRQLHALRLIGHDLRSALSTVMLSNAILERQLKGTPQEAQLKYVTKSKTAANSALDYLTEAVTYARSEDIHNAGEPVTLALCNTLNDIVSYEVNRFGAAADKVIIDCPQDAQLAHVLAFPLTAILNNLISNAIKYTPDPEGRVRISVKSLGAKTPGISGCTLIEIADDGVGIPPAFVKRMFTAFSRADNVDSIEGTGLGLAIVANALKALDAEINVISTPEVPRGSVFTLILPNELVRAKPPEKQSEKSSAR